MKMPGSSAAAVVSSERKHVQAITVIAAVGALAMLGWSAFSMVNGLHWIGIANFLVALLYGGVILGNLRGHPRAAPLALLLVMYAQLVFALIAFGHASGIYLFFPLMALIPYLVFRAADHVLAHFFALIGVAGLMASLFWREYLPVRVAGFDTDQAILMNGLIVVAGLAVFGFVFMRTITRVEDALVQAHARTRELLFRVLPEPVAEVLEAQPDQRLAERFDEAAVMFVDIAGFTRYAAAHSAEETVALLNDLFSGFDAACARHGVEKISTSGDGYLAVAGVPVPVEDPAGLMVRTAFDVLATASAKGIDIRIGINCGEVVAGVIGKSRFHYDVWGDTVNVAARMESTGETGRIHISESVHERIARRFACTPRGTIEVKGKGAMPTWFVEGPARDQTP